MHRPRWAFYGCALWTLAAAATLGAVAAQGPPTLTKVSPGALAPGQTTELVLEGTHLVGELHLWTSFPARVEWLDSDANDAPAPRGDAASGKEAPTVHVRCRVTVPPSVAGGIGGLAVATQQGISDVAYVMLDDLPSVPEASENHTPEHAQPLKLPTAVDGQSDGTLSDFFRFEARQGERIACEVVASRLGWDYDALLRICGPDGSECLVLDDDPSTGADPRGVFIARQDGLYLIELRDNRYKLEGRYRLRLGHVPSLTCAQPLVVQAGVPTPLTATDISGQRHGPRELLVAAASGPWSAVPIAILPEAPGSGSALIGVTDLPVWHESHLGASEEASTASSAAKSPLVPLPAVIAGTLQQPGEIDEYRFAAKKGVSVQFRAVSRSLLSPAVVSLRVSDASGKRLAENPPADSDEPVWVFTPPADGEYALQVSDLVGRGGPQFSYAVVLRQGPAFALQLKNDKNNRWRHAVPPGGVLALDVQCQRQGEEGPIELAIDSPRAGWQLVGGRIAAKTNETRIYLGAPQDLVPGEIVSLRLVGRSSSGDRGAVSLTTQAMLRAARPACPYPPAWHDGLLLVSGLAGEPPWFRVEPAAGPIFFARQVGTARWELKVHRLSEVFRQGTVAIVPQGLPPGVSAESKRRGNESPEIWEVTFKGPTNLPEGSHFVRFFLVGESGGQMRGLWTGNVELQVASPLGVAVQWPAALVAGQTQRVEVTVIRRGGNPQPVELRLKAIPRGLRGPERVTVAADASQASFDVTALEDAPVGSEATLVVVATTRFGETTIEAESPAHTLQIKAP
jgi:hypothetical protein